MENGEGGGLGGGIGVLVWYRGMGGKMGGWRSGGRVEWGKGIFEVRV